MSTRDKRVSRKEAEEKSEEIVSVVTSEEYLNQLEKVRQAPAEKRLKAGTQHLTSRALREQGAEVPEELLISSRLFDDQIGKETEFGDPDPEQPNVIRRLDELDPEYISRLRESDPKLFRDILDDQNVGFGSENPLAVCACVGAAGVCAGVGW